MDEFLISVLIQLPVAGIFLALYLKLWSDYKALQKQYIDQIEGQLRNKDIDKAGAARHEIVALE